MRVSKMWQSAREQPFPEIIVKGALQDCKVAIIAEKQVLCEFSGGLVDTSSCVN